MYAEIFQTSNFSFSAIQKTGYTATKPTLAVKVNFGTVPAIISYLDVLFPNQVDSNHHGPHSQLNKQIYWIIDQNKQDNLYYLSWGAPFNYFIIPFRSTSSHHHLLRNQSPNQWFSSQTKLKSPGGNFDLPEAIRHSHAPKRRRIHSEQRPGGIFNALPLCKALYQSGSSHLLYRDLKLTFIVSAHFQLQIA